MYKVKLPTALLISLALLCASAALAATWPPTDGEWIKLPGFQNPIAPVAPNNLNDEDSTVAGHYDFVGSDAEPGGYYQFDAEYVYLRMRMDTPTFSTSYGTNLYLLIDIPGVDVYTNTPAEAADYRVDYALVFGNVSAGNTTLSRYEAWNATGNVKWGFTQLGATATSLPGSSVRIQDNQGTADSPFGVDSYVDWAIAYADMTQLELATFRFQFASGPIPYDYQPSTKNNWEDVAGFCSPDTSSDTFDDPQDWAQLTVPEPASMALTLLAVGFAGGVARRRKTKNEAGREE